MTSAGSSPTGRTAALDRLLTPRDRVVGAPSWARRHRLLLTVLWAHAVLLLAPLLAAGHGLADALVVLLPATVASSPRLPRAVREIALSLGLAGTTVMVVQLAGGATEAHFHVFVVVPLLALYRRWLPYVAHVAVVLLHDLVLAAVLDRPPTLALLHGGLVLVAATATMVAWRLHEDERDLAEQEVRRLHRQNELILDAVGAGIFGIDAAGRCTFANPTAASLLGWPDPEALVGCDVHETVHHSLPDGTRQSRAECALDACLRSGRSGRWDGAVLWRADGSRLIVDLDLRPLPDGGGVVTIRDATERTARAADEEQAAARLRAALRAGALQLWYQPKIGLADGSVRGVEALARWCDGSRGWVPPDDFVALAERTGIIWELTTWSLRAAVRQAAAWRAAGHDVPVAVNISAAVVADARLPDLIAATLTGSGLPPDALEIEVTETSLLADPDAAMRTLHRVRALGVQVALDDFGTGYSSLTYLSRMPATTVKIDKTFVVDLTSDGPSGAIVHSTVDLAHDLGLAVVAEGVESAVVADALRHMGCDVAQGYHWSRPMPPAAATAWLCRRLDLARSA